MVFMFAPMGSHCAHHHLLLWLFLLFLSLLCVPSFSLSFDYNPLGTSNQQSLQVLSDGDVFFQPSSVELSWSHNSSPQWCAGRLYNSEKLFLWDEASGGAASFNCSFQFRIRSNSASNYSAEGLTFFLINPNNINLPSNANGAWLGLFAQFSNGSASDQIVAVEFDTYWNQDFLDPSANHIGVDVNNIISSKWQANLDFSLAKSTSVYAWVDYSSSQNLLEVYSTNRSRTKPSSPLLSYSINLTLYLPQYVYVGFSASTGQEFENHSVLSWSFYSTPIGVAASTPKSSSSHEKGSKIGLFSGLGSGALILILALFVGRRKLGSIINGRSRIPSGLDPTGLSFLSPASGPREFTYRELSIATKHFSHAQLLGQGGFGPVYKGVLSEPDGSEVAVKCISQKSSQGEKEFFAEVSIISCIHHRHLVQLRGWCREEGNLMLVYEFLPNGSLDRYLFGKAAATLDWGTRYRIACGLGSAVQYLHEECEKVIVHRDIKASNVILDSNFNAKLGDFGLARQLREGEEWRPTSPAGTVGYMAPECHGTRRATMESDVYSFGTVLLEVACGRRAVDFNRSTEYDEERLLDWVWGLYAEGRLSEAADGRLKGAFDEEQLRRMLVIGLACSHTNPKWRPTIRLAVDALQERVPLPILPTSKAVADCLLARATSSTRPSYSVLSGPR